MPALFIEQGFIFLALGYQPTATVIPIIPATAAQGGPELNQQHAIVLGLRAQVASRPMT